LSFLTPALTAGALLIALPIVLHLVMRRQPRQLVFPALRFVANRRSSNQTRLKLRHIILLLLRCAAIGLLAFALARPALRGSGLKGGETGLVSAALVIDNSPRMEYVDKTETRLAAAQEMATWLLEQLPADSRVAVLERGDRRGKRLADRDAGLLRVRRMKPTYRTRPLEDTVRDAVDLLTENEGDRHELYLFTDMAAADWPEETRQAIRNELERLPEAKLLLVDVGADEVSNRGLGGVVLSDSQLAEGEPLTIQTPVFAVTPTANRANAKPLLAQLWLQSDGKREKRGETLVTLDASGRGVARFTLSSLDESDKAGAVHQGVVRLADADALPIDDERYFTVEVQPPRPVLLAATNSRASLFVDQALAPLDPAGSQPSVYQTERATFAQLAQANLADYQSVWLLDPPPLDTRVWRRLDDYAREGGAVAIALGRRAKLSAMNAPAPQALLAARLRWRSRDATYLRPLQYNHPALAQLADFAAAIPWAEFPVYQYWQLDALDESAVVLAPFANGDGAIVERQVGKGRVLTITTPLSDPASGEPWNLLPTGQDPWPFLALTKNLADYLGGATDRRWNYAAGEAAIVPAPRGEALTGYVLQTPDEQSIKMPPPGLGEIVVGATNLPGNYRLKAGGQRGRLDTGFSVNCADDVGLLQRISIDQLQQSIGEDRIAIARNRSTLARQVDVGRVGRELYPWLIALVALALGAEHLISNRFYEQA